MRVLVLGLALSLTSVSAFAQAGGGMGAGSSGEADAIKKIAAAYQKASSAGDAKAIAALYTEDAVEMPPNEPLIKGRAAIEQYYRKLFGDPNVKMSNFSINHVSAGTSGDFGWNVGTYKQTITMGGKAVQDSGKFSVILKKVGGEWKVAYAIYNSDQPPMMPMGGGAKTP